MPVDISAANPNGMEFDNLFLDMNGIIHNCTHGEDLDVIPTTHQAMFKNIADYLDRLIHVVRPRRMVRSLFSSPPFSYFYFFTPFLEATCVDHRIEMLSLVVCSN